MLKLFSVNKQYWLIGGTIIMLFISYQMAFKKTIEAWRLHEYANVRITKESNLDLQPGYLVRQKGNLEKIIALYRADTVQMRSNILYTVSLLAVKNNVRLKEVPDRDPALQTNKYVIQKLILEGDYFKLIQALAAIEQTPDIGFIRSFTLKVPEHISRPADHFPLMEVYLQIAK